MVEPAADLSDAGRLARRTFPRSSLAELGTEPRDPLGILAAQNATRLPHLVPLRRERMSQSLFTFYRGTAALMAADLGQAPSSGLLVASCGDAHVSNFGFYASPQRSLVFDLNDFDEAAWAPWEWDVKRLVTSVIIGGRDAGHPNVVVDRAARRTVQRYVHALKSNLQLSPVERFFIRMDADDQRRAAKGENAKVLRKAVRAAERRTGNRAVHKLTGETADGRLKFATRPPTMTELPTADRATAHDLIEQYYRSTSPDIRMLLDHYQVVDLARRAVGVGSVGTRCSLVLFQSRDGDALILQTKQAGRSVLEEYGGAAQPKALEERIAERGEGARVVGMQRILQAVSDPFLGFLRNDGTDLYVRQFHDMKGAIEVSRLDAEPFTTYAEACAVTLARAHSQSVGAAAVAGYIGSGKRVTDAIVAWAMKYADVAAADYRAFLAQGE